MEVKDLIREFCDAHSDKYYVYENYSGRFMFGAKCIGIVVRSGYSYLEMLMSLTKYLDEMGYKDEGLLLEGVSIDELGLDTVVYFPKIQS